MPEQAKAMREFFGDEEIKMRLEDRERISKVEGKLDQLSTEVSELTKNVKYLVGSFAEYRTAVAKPNWQVWIGMASILLVLIGAQNFYWKQSIITEAHTRNVMWAHQFRMNQELGHACNVYVPSEPYYFPEPP
jgi:hypothetical protein